MSLMKNMDGVWLNFIAFIELLQIFAEDDSGTQYLIGKIHYLRETWN